MNVIKKTSNQPSKKIEQRDKEKRQYTHDNGLSWKNCPFSRRHSKIAIAWSSVYSCRKDRNESQTLEERRKKKLTGRQFWKIQDYFLHWKEDSIMEHGSGNKEENVMRRWRWRKQGRKTRGSGEAPLDACIDYQLAVSSLRCTQERKEDVVRRENPIPLELRANPSAFIQFSRRRIPDFLAVFEKARRCLILWFRDLFEPEIHIDRYTVKV